MTIADFNISASGPEDVGYDATNGEVLTLQLANLPATDVYRLQFSVTQFSKDMPAPVFSPVSGEPTTPGGTVTLTCAASDTHSFIIDSLVNNGIDQSGVMRADYRSSRLVAIRNVNGLAKIVPGETTQYDTANGWTGRVNEMIDATDVLATATVDPTPNTLLLRGPVGEGKCTSFEASAGGQFRVNVSGDLVNVGSVDGSKNIQIGDTLQAASLTLLAKANGNIAAAVDGTGVAGMAALGASSRVTLISNSVTVFDAVGGLPSINGTSRISLQIAGSALADIVTGGLSFSTSTKAIKSKVGASALSLVADDGAGVVTLGDVAQATGISIVAKSAAPVNIYATGVAGTASIWSNEVEVLRAVGGLLKAPRYGSLNGTSATAGLFAAANSDSNILTVLNSGGTADITVAGISGNQLTFGTGSAGLRFSTASDYHSFSIGSATIVSLKTTGLEFDKDSTFGITQAQSTSGAGRNFSIIGQRGAAGTNGANLSFAVGDAGTAGSDLQGEFAVALGKSGDLTGILRVTGGAFGDLLTVSYDDTVGETAVSSPTYQLTLFSGAGVTINASGGNAQISAGGSNSVILSAGSTGIQVQQSSGLKLGFFAASPVAKPTVTGSRGGNAALASLLTGLANLGLITDSSS